MARKTKSKKPTMPKVRSVFMDNYRAMQAFGQQLSKPRKAPGKLDKASPQRDASGRFVAKSKSKSKKSQSDAKKEGANEGKTSNS